jgi:hypothetical protein
MTKPWVPNAPEQRLSIAVDRLLSRTLEQPHYVTAINDSDHGTRTDQQRARDANRGVKGGQLDWHVWQGRPFVARMLELKRGRNDITPLQKVTVDQLALCGAPPVVARTLRAVHVGLALQGFRFTANVEVVLALLEEHLLAWDREADAIRSGEVVRKSSTSKPRAVKPTLAQIRRVAAVRGRVMF